MKNKTNSRSIRALFCLLVAGMGAIPHTMIARIPKEDVAQLWGAMKPEDRRRAIDLEAKYHILNKIDQKMPITELEYAFISGSRRIDESVIAMKEGKPLSEQTSILLAELLQPTSLVTELENLYYKKTIISRQACDTTVKVITQPVTQNTDPIIEERNITLREKPMEKSQQGFAYIAANIKVPVIIVISMTRLAAKYARSIRT